MSFIRRDKNVRQTRYAENEKVRKNKMVILRKRQVAAVSLILLIGIAGYLNVSIKNGDADPNVSVMYTEASKRLGEAKMVNGSDVAPENEDDGKNNDASVELEYFINAKQEREKKRAESIDMLISLINSDGAEKSAKENAQKQVELLSAFTECEVAAENMIKAKGYGDCIVFMGENVTSVAVRTNGLNEIDAAVIIDLVASSGLVKPENVKIVEIKPN
ncbi:MAG: SpoIIIAH-like family protein [Clostridia bacterium]|nr:SpoIIIAH-like family protein [Clostridia bacterium]